MKISTKQRHNKSHHRKRDGGEWKENNNIQRSNGWDGKWKVSMLRDIKSKINKMYVLWNQYKINLVEILYVSQRSWSSIRNLIECGVTKNQKKNFARPWRLRGCCMETSKSNFKNRRNEHTSKQICDFRVDIFCATFFKRSFILEKEFFFFCGTRTINTFVRKPQSKHLSHRIDNKPWTETWGKDREIFSVCVFACMNMCEEFQRYREKNRERFASTCTQNSLKVKCVHCEMKCFFLAHYSAHSKISISLPWFRFRVASNKAFILISIYYVIFLPFPFSNPFFLFLSLCFPSVFSVARSALERQEL